MYRSSILHIATTAICPVFPVVYIIPQEAVIKKTLIEILTWVCDNFGNLANRNCALISGYGSFLLEFVNQLNLGEYMQSGQLIISHLIWQIRGCGFNYPAMVLDGFMSASSNKKLGECIQSGIVLSKARSIL